jgi:transcriptional regulator with XRE-family HTH domain
MSFDTRLRQLREGAGLSQEQVAARAGIPIDSIQNWEQGRTRPRLEALPKLAQALAVTVDQLLATNAQGDGGTPRGRGRPKQAPPAGPPPAKRPRGRPRKGK